MRIWRLPRPRPRRPILVRALIAAVAISVLLLIWRGPWWLDGRYLSTQGLREGSAALVSGFRAAVVQIAVAGGALVALSFTARTYRLNQRGQVTDRFTKALELLESEKEYIRVGGILNLDQVVRDAPDHAPGVIYVLTAFVRERSPHASFSSPHPIRKFYRAAKLESSRITSLMQKDFALPIDVQKALTTLTHGSLRHWAPSERIDLSGLNLIGAKLDDSDFSGDVWVRSGFEHLSGELLRPNIFPSQLMKIRRWTSHALLNMDDVRIHHTDLSGTDLSQAELNYANLTNVNLSGANLTGARLVGANLTRASMKGARLAEANLDFAILDTDLSDVKGLTVEQLESTTLRHPMWLPDDIAGDPRIAAYFRERPHLLSL